ncbi:MULTISPECIES: VOC family protein [Sphingobacterium]|uniref:Glyoxalase/bleomycin resistance/extradiol dioxygenase family protein n=1 Tax=Sphingobacterium athyrii TaxID=2152717 RepID=A0A363NX53_9SPHI|nr:MULTISPECIES: VOC family protein [Sphingobacterium]PUV25293.1 glyoxalase/bleomycin resistance/extradiol dioxygenase family protein [Sphingobacterium athyrii]QIH34577.1 VOC family protein [Sphingobacterium sp. DR205]
MELNHINLVVRDVDKAVELFSTHMGFELIINRNSKMAVMENNKKFALVIWGQVMNNEEKEPDYPKNFHIGFYQEDENSVYHVYDKIKDELYLRVEDVPKKMRNTFGFYFYFENLMIEISVNPF